MGTEHACVKIQNKYLPQVTKLRMALLNTPKLLELPKTKTPRYYPINPLKMDNDERFDEMACM